MSVTMQIPTALRLYTAGLPDVTVAGETAGEALTALTSSYPIAGGVR